MLSLRTRTSVRKGLIADKLFARKRTEDTYKTRGDSHRLKSLMQTNIQSLMATAKRNGLDPSAWLTDMLTKLPAHPNRRIDELLPFAGYRFG
jgi:hypothetical protein